LLEQLELDEAVAQLSAQKKQSGSNQSKAKPIQPAKKRVKQDVDEVVEPRRQSTRLKRTAADPNETPAKRRKREVRNACNYLQFACVIFVQQEEEALRKKLEEERLIREEQAREASKPRHHDMDFRTLMGEETVTMDMELAALRSSLEVVTRSPHPRRTADQDAFVDADDKEDKKERHEVDTLKEELGSLKVISRAKVTQDRIYSAAYHPEPTKDLVFFGGQSTWCCKRYCH
jgi:WD repeat-containing protein 76